MIYERLSKYLWINLMNVVEKKRNDLIFCKMKTVLTQSVTNSI